MSADWKTVSLGDVCKLTAGSAFKNKYQGETSGEHPFIKVSDMNLDGNEVFIRHSQNFVSENVRKEMKAKLHPAGAVVFAKIGVALTTNRRRILTRPTIIDNNMMSATPFDGVIRSRFLYYALKGMDFNLISSGSALPYLNASDLQKLELLLPALDVQDDVSRILGGIDDRIILLRETNVTLEAIAQTLFKSWFVDFDPVRAKAEGREPEGVPPEVVDQFADELIESELGEIPEGWEARKVEAVLTRLTTKVKFTKTDVFPSGKIPVFEQGVGVILGYHNGQPQFQATPEEPLFVFGDHTCIMRLSCQPFDISANVIPLKGRDRPSLWAYYAVKDKQQFQEYRRHWMELLVKDVVVPPETLCVAFSKIASVLHKKIEANEIYANTLAALREALLPRLMSGKLPITEAEKELEAV